MMDSSNCAKGRDVAKACRGIFRKAFLQVICKDLRSGSIASKAKRKSGTKFHVATF